MTDDLTLFVRGLRLSGWNSIRITRGIERCPNDFEISMTERYPGELNEFIVEPGDPCTVKLGDDLVINGYVERYVPSISAGSHTIQLVGRGRCADLVDCAAEWPGSQIVASSALAIAQKLCEPYSLTATCLGDVGPQIPKLILNQGQTAFEIIESVCRFAALLAYEGTDGNLILSRVGKTKAASGFQQGVNVQSASIAYSVDQRFSDYVVMRMSMDTLQDAGDTGNVVSIAYDQSIVRHRKRVIIAESGDPGSVIAQQRAQWECNRRIGRSAQLRLTTDGWRDSAGTLYTPNTLVDLLLPALTAKPAQALSAQPKTWLISEVTYRRDESGTACDLVIMPPEAFLPQPILLQPGAGDIPFNPGKS